MLYILNIIIAMILIIIGNLIFNVFNLSFWYITLAVVIATLSVILVDGIFAIIIRRLLPKKWFGKDVKIYNTGKKECKFYEKLGIKKWKDKVMELGVFTGFHKDKLGDASDNKYIERFLVESNYGVVIHWACIINGFLIILIKPKLWLAIGVPVAIVNAILNALSLMILRYNTPRLKIIYKRNERLAERQKAKELEEVAIAKEEKQ